ncbi:translation initiation factor IF-2-like [Peromyscus leucopus]|uniref:translation initiation factor IF-2-like n=1 Tax=Peromyscus leucopus TaxID=10041 RepID=UPI001885740D|nr:translation initiation factor IF-2-like [Peromyscus leucopus]
MPLGFMQPAGRAAPQALLLRRVRGSFGGPRAGSASLSPSRTRGSFPSPLARARPSLLPRRCLRGGCHLCRGESASPAIRPPVGSARPWRRVGRPRHRQAGKPRRRAPRWRRSGERARAGPAGRSSRYGVRPGPVGGPGRAGPGLLPCGRWACGDARRFPGTPWPPGRLLAALVAERAAAVWPSRCQGAETLAGDGCRVHSACPTWQVSCCHSLRVEWLG